MQATLVEAATELLIEHGWAATTAVAVCARAGCTRGALVHHYPSLSALLAHALETIYADFLERTEPPPTDLVETVDRLWAAMGDRRFKAVLEAWSAAGNDPDLAVELAPTIARFATLVSLGGADASKPRDRAAADFLLLAREAMLGLALGRSVTGGQPLGHEPIVLGRLREEAAALDRRRKPATRS